MVHTPNLPPSIARQDGYCAITGVWADRSVACVMGGEISFCIGDLPACCSDRQEVGRQVPADCGVRPVTQAGLKKVLCRDHEASSPIVNSGSPPMLIWSDPGAAVSRQTTPPPGPLASRPTRVDKLANRKGERIARFKSAVEDGDVMELVMHLMRPTMRMSRHEPAPGLNCDRAASRGAPLWAFGQQRPCALHSRPSACWNGRSKRCGWPSKC